MAPQRLSSTTIYFFCGILRTYPILRQALQLYTMSSLPLHERFICFPVSTKTEHPGYVPRDYDGETDFDHTIKMKICTPMKNWDKLQKSIPIEDIPYSMGIRTGEVGGITAVVNSTDLTIPLKTPRMNLYNNKFGVLFQYEPTLINIHEVMPYVSIINDGRFLLLGDTRYLMHDEYEVMKMPPELLSTLEQAIESSIQANQFLYELISILPDDYFNDINLFKKIIFVLRNKDDIKIDIRLATLKKLVLDRSWSFLVEDMDDLFKIKMSSSDKKYTYQQLIKTLRVLNNETRQQVDEWNSKWNINKTAHKTKTGLQYSQHAEISLTDIKKLYPKLTTSMILKMDSRFKMTRVNTCKSCHNRHIKGCCDRYARNNSTKTIIIKNASLS